MELKRNAVDLTELAIGILILGIVTAIGAKILVTQRDARLTDLSINTTTNETLSFAGGNVATLANQWGISVTSVCNATGTILNAGNYTSSLSALDGTLTITNLTNRPYYATYTFYDISRPDWSLPNDASIGIAEYGNWFRTIVIVGVAALVLALIFLGLGRSQAQSESGGSY